MHIDIVVRLDAKASDHAHENEVQFAIRQQRAGAHAVAETIGENGGVGVLEETLGAEDFGVVPDGVVHVAGPRVEEDDGAGGDVLTFVDDVFCRGAGEGQAEDAVVSTYSG